MNVLSPFYTLTSLKQTLLFDTRSGKPALAYWGEAIIDLSLLENQIGQAQYSDLPALPAIPRSIGLAPLLGDGFFGSPSLEVHRLGNGWDTNPILVEVLEGARSLEFVSRCESHGIELRQRVQLNQADVVEFQTTLVNRAASNLCVDFCASVTVGLPNEFNSILSLHGRWGLEFQPQHTVVGQGTFLIENRTGRTSHDSSPTMLIGDSNSSQNAGQVYGFHLGWSGNYQLRYESLATGQKVVQLGELLLPGEVILGPGETYVSPIAYLSFSNAGFNGLSQQYHAQVNSALRGVPSAREKPVHFNTWEALYFSHDLSRLFTLAERAAAVGVERFVLDDGWFKGRNSDQSNLGDWTPDPFKYPEGLKPLIDKVDALGMEFGLWVEPEMVNPDSDLYRAHPDWVLRPSADEPTLARHQLVLDLTRLEVQDYLFERLSELLSQNAIGYLKWDMNRVIHQPSAQDGRASVSRYVRSLYALLARLRDAFPNVVIESCSSGGGRADFGILGYTDRIWPSDSNDALDRLRIQQGFSYLFPVSVMGSHVGPRKCHLTGRELSMQLRAGVAMLGHMGIECDLTELSEVEFETLQAGVAAYKDWRWLTIQGDFFRLEVDDSENACQFIASDQSVALVSYALLDSRRPILPRRLRLVGLDPVKAYELELVWPVTDKFRDLCEEITSGPVLGEALMHWGIELPRLVPGSIVTFALRKIASR
jgi:alpha-galactosidase